MLSDLSDDHTAEECKGGDGWVGDAHGGMPWDPCPQHWPTEPVARGRVDGPQREFKLLHIDEAEAMFPGFCNRKDGT